jgi:hypothetical protein
LAAECDILFAFAVGLFSAQMCADADAQRR